MDKEPSFPIGRPEDTSLAIPSAKYPDVHALAARIQDEWRRISSLSGESQSVPPPAQIVEVIPAAIIRTMAIAATDIWKLRVKMTHAGSGAVKEEFKRLYRHVENIVESFSDIGIEIKDRTGEIFDYGLPENVVATQPKAGISKKFVIETVKPTIYFNGQILQSGEVIIVTPEESNPLESDPA